MKNLIIAFSILFFSMPFLSAQSSGSDVVFVFTDLKSNDGKVLVGLFNSEDSYLESEFKSFHGEIKNNTCTVTFKNVPNGTYAASMFHDENNNEELDTNFMGIPKEAYGFSNDAKGVFGPAKWKNAKFEVKDQSISQTLKL